MHVMQFLTSFESGGTERQTLNLGLSLARRGQVVQFGCLRRAGRLLGEVERAQIPVHAYPLRSLYSPRIAFEALRLGRDLRRSRVDVMHAYNFYGNVFAVPAARLSGVPLVIAGIRDVGLYLDARKRRVQRMACRFADLILVNAESIRTWLRSEGYPVDRVEVIHNGIDLTAFDWRDDDGTFPVCRALGLPPGTPLVATVARLCRSKGLEDAIDAMALVHAVRPDVHQIVVGEELVSRNGELHPGSVYRAALEQRARSLGLGGHVHFLGHRTDVPQILREVTVSVQPSHTEGLSNSVLEAMAAGCAVVATPVGGTPEVIDDGQTGWMVPVGDPRALGQIVLRLLADEGSRRRTGAAAKRLVQERLSVPAMVKATERLYMERLEQKRRTGDARLRPGSAVAAT